MNPYGYTPNEDNTAYEINPDEAAVVRQLYKMAALQGKRAAIYARCAAVQERGSSFAIEAQVHECRQHIRTQGYQLVEGQVYTETMKGSTLDRPMLTALCQSARRGEFDVLVAYEYERLARSLSLVAALLADLEHSGVRVESVREPFVGNAILLLDVKAAVAETEREMITQRTRRSHSRKEQ